MEVRLLSSALKIISLVIFMTPEKEKQQRKELREKRNKNRAKKTWLIFGIIFLVLFAGRSVWGVIGVVIPYSEGERIVKIIKVANKGLIWKTWEAEGVLTQGNFSVTYVWSFSIDDWDPNKEELVKDIHRAFENGQTVIIKYDQRAGSVPWRSKTTYFIKEVRFQE